MGNVFSATKQLKSLAHPFGIIVVLVIANGCWLYFYSGASFWTVLLDFATGNGSMDALSAGAFYLTALMIVTGVGFLWGYTPADLLAAAGIPVPSYLPWPLSMLGSSSAFSAGGRSGVQANMVGRPPEPGACGLTNLGNTCYMSATVQCLSAIPELTDNFLVESRPAHTATAPAPAAATARAFSTLVRDMWGSAYTAVTPSQLLATFAAHPAGFVPGEQQDCSEFLVALLDSLHDALKGDAPVQGTAAGAGSPLPLAPSPVAGVVRAGEALLASPRLTGFSAADSAWENHMSGGRSSLIAQLCTGQSVCRTVCPSPGCGGIARSYEALQYLALPLPVVYKSYRVRVVSPVVQLGWGAFALGLPYSEGGTGLLRPSCPASDWPKELPVCWVVPVTVAHPCSADVLRKAVREQIVQFLSSRMTSVASHSSHEGGSAHPHPHHEHELEHEEHELEQGKGASVGKGKKKKGGKGGKVPVTSSPAAEQPPPSSSSSPSPSVSAASAAAGGLIDSLDLLLAEVHLGILTRELEDRASTRTIKEDGLVAYLAPRWYKEPPPAQAGAQGSQSAAAPAQGPSRSPGEVLYGATAVLHRHRVWHPDPSPEYMRHPKGKSDPLPFLQGIVMPAQPEAGPDGAGAGTGGVSGEQKESAPPPFRVPKAWHALIDSGFSKGQWRHPVTSSDDLYSLPQVRPDFYPTVMVQPGSLPLLLRVPEGATMTHITTAAQGWAEVCKMNVLGAQAPYDWEGRWREDTGGGTGGSAAETAHGGEASQDPDDSVLIHDTILPDHTRVSAARVGIARANKEVANAGPWWMGYTPNMHWAEYRGEYCATCGKASCVCDAGRLPALKARQAVLAQALSARPDLLPRVQGEVTAELVEERLMGTDVPEGDPREDALYESLHKEVVTLSPIILAEQAALLTPLSFHAPPGGDSPEQFTAALMGGGDTPCTAIPVPASIPSALCLDWFSPADLPRQEDSLSLAGPWAAYDALWAARERQLPVVRQVLEKRLAAQEKKEKENSEAGSAGAGHVTPTGQPVLQGGPALSLPDPMTAIPIQVVSAQVGGLLFHPPTHAGAVLAATAGAEKGASGTSSSTKRSGLPGSGSGKGQGQDDLASPLTATPPKGPRGQAAGGAVGAPGTPDFQGAPPTPLIEAAPGPGGKKGKKGGKGGKAVEAPEEEEGDEFTLNLGPSALPAASSSSSGSANLAFKPGKPSQAATLAKCLDLYTAESTLDEGNAWACPKCGVRVRAKQSTALVRAPPVLIITLKRFVHLNDWGDTEKLDAVVDFPVTALDLTPWMSKESGGGGSPGAGSGAGAGAGPSQPASSGKVGGKGAKTVLATAMTEATASPFLYDLFAVVHHAGTLAGGHYIAHTRHPASGLWYTYNDHLVRPTIPLQQQEVLLAAEKAHKGQTMGQGPAAEEVDSCSKALKAALATSAAYVLFYRRRS